MYGEEIVKSSGLPREEVFKEISVEREYQNSIAGRWENKGIKGILTVGEEILVAQEYLKKARELYVFEEGGDHDARDMMRKVAAILVRCFEHHGVPHRNPESTVQ